MPAASAGVRMTKQTPHTYTHTHTLPASRDVVTARRPIEGGGAGPGGPAPSGCVTGAGPRLRATSRGAAGGVCGGVAGLHVCMFAHAEGSADSARPRRLCDPVSYASRPPIFAPSAPSLFGLEVGDTTAKDRRDAQRVKAFAAELDAGVRSPEPTWWTDSYKLPSARHTHAHKHTC